MSYSRSPELDHLVQQELATGRYSSPEDVLLAAVRLLREQDAYEEQFRHNLKARLERIDRGQAIELEDDEELKDFFDDVQRRGQERYDARRLTP